MPRYGYRRRRRYESRDRGMEFAHEHIREAEELSRELGGTDEDVKEYFFSLLPAELRPILSEYGSQHGADKRAYAEQTLPRWRSGERKMSGLVASRLFKLLPRYMPLDRKYALVESLWAKCAPRSEHSVSFGRETDPRAVSEVVRKHLEATVNGHSIDEGLQRRFQWLAAGDSRVMQQLLNHFLSQDKQEASQLVAAQLALLATTLRDNAAIQGFSRELKVGGHTVHVFFDPRATEVTLSSGSPHCKAAPDYGCLVGIAIVAFIFILIWLFKSK